MASPTLEMVLQSMAIEIQATKTSKLVFLASPEPFLIHDCLFYGHFWMRVILVLYEVIRDVILESMHQLDAKFIRQTLI